ncbi:MAG: malonyl-CoA decarboxylase [Pseudomonadota bacterium]
MSANRNLLDRTLLNLRSAWRGIASLGRDTQLTDFSPDLNKAERVKLREHIRACLDGKGGEVSARSRAAALGELYLSLSTQGRQTFLRLLSRDFAVDHTSVAELATKLQSCEEDQERMKIEARLRRELSPPYLTLLTQFNALPQGVKFLVDMRTDLLACKRGDAHLEMLDEVLRERLSVWFDIGFLELRRITWDAPAALLEKLVNYEAVHRIKSWRDLKNRLEDDRRCFAYFHPRMPDEPLIFVWVALVEELSNNVTDLLNVDAIRNDPNQASTAIFYSISNTQTGLQRVSLGNFLIKRVVDELLKELPQLKTFSTLSPIPGFSAWLKEYMASDVEPKLLDAEIKALNSVGGDVMAVLEAKNWHKDKESSAALENPLTRLCAHYLVNEKRRNRSIDPVANFHLTNGAKVERINWLGDLSKKGLRDSHGLMVNYLYELKSIETNHELYRESFQVSASKSVSALADKSLSYLRAS